MCVWLNCRFMFSPLHMLPSIVAVSIQIMLVRDEESIAELCEDRFRSSPRIGCAERVPQRRLQTDEPLCLPEEHILQVGTSGRGWLPRSLPKGQQYTSDCEPIGKVLL